MFLGAGVFPPESDGTIRRFHVVEKSAVKAVGALLPSGRVVVESETKVLVVLHDLEELRIRLDILEEVQWFDLNGAPAPQLARPAPPPSFAPILEEPEPEQTPVTLAEAKWEAFPGRREWATGDAEPADRPEAVIDRHRWAWVWSSSMEEWMHHQHGVRSHTWMALSMSVAPLIEARRVA
jgi:hypothetical protein